MADERMDESRKTMKITVKTPKEKQEMEIDTNAHVKEVNLSFGSYEISLKPLYNQYTRLLLTLHMSIIALSRMFY